MGRGLQGIGALLAALLACLVAGIVAGRATGSAWIGVLASGFVGVLALLLGESVKGARLVRWLRAEAPEPVPEVAGIWGEVAYQVRRLLRGQQQVIAREQQRLEQFLSAVEASPIGVVLLDAQQHITWCSRMAADHLGLDPQRDLGQRVTNLVRAPAFVELMAGDADQPPVTFAGAAGNRLSTLVQPYGDGLRLVLTQDITERERAELMRRNFVANVSHEIRTPLTVLAGFVETMSELQLSEVERKRVLAVMASQAQRMQDLVSDLLTLAQLEGSPRPAADRWVDVSALLKQAEADAQALSAGRHELLFDRGDDAQIAGNEAELQSALNNLVFNAVRYTPVGGRIEVDWSVQDGGWGMLRVSDTGIGIEREHLPRLTERFYRVDSSRSRDTGGTGLGLSIVKHVIQRHGGEIDIQSEPGKGSTFRLRLPPSRVRSATRTAHGVVSTPALP